ncbi:MAG: 1-deoxy-D-xylulose-5-phosphate reductoisomerase, partial [Firmicutes bacterium]|nr:1-deoxy-D-xylulose-5-phosphate reductoisomerase [Bacillota bacterium]
AASLVESDMVVNSLLGMMGIRPTYEAIKAGRSIAFANKETLVAAGSLIMAAVKEKGVSFLPVDSEHSAIFQSLQGSAGNPIERILLTASGGPFRGYTKEQLEKVTLAQALRHPNWSMGAKITVDSATMMNKGLEIIEASWLFDVPAEKITVLVHPESALHSAVEFADGSIIGQMGAPDMHIPIAYALSYPERIPGAGKPLDLAALGTLHFEKPDPEVFRCLGLAYSAIKAGGSFPCCMNAANEEAVAAFLKEKISFVQIADVVDHCLSHHDGRALDSVDAVEELEKAVRSDAAAYIKTIA